MADGNYRLPARGWGGRIRTSVWRNQNPLPYRLATPQRSGSGAASDARDNSSPRPRSQCSRLAKPSAKASHRAGAETPSTSRAPARAAFGTDPVSIRFSPQTEGRLVSPRLRAKYRGQPASRTHGRRNGGRHRRRDGGNASARQRKRGGQAVTRLGVSRESQAYRRTPRDRRSRRKRARRRARSSPAGRRRT